MDQVGLAQLGLPPNSNISHLHEIGWYNPINNHLSPFFQLLKVIHIGKWVVWPCVDIYKLGAYKVMHLLGIHNSLTQNYEWTTIIMSCCTLNLFNHILMYTHNPLKLHVTQHYKCIHNYVSYKSNITGWPWIHLYQCNSKIKKN